MRILRSIACAAGFGLAFAATTSANEMTGPVPGAAPGPAPQFDGAAPQAASNPTLNLGLLYTPIAPCRAFSTAVGGGVIAANTARTFIIAGSSSFAAQGGPTRGCGVPAYATAVSMSFTTANSGTGFLRAFAAGAAVPPTQVLSYRAGLSLTASQTVQMRAGRITVSANTAATNVAGDVTGFYAPQIQGLIFIGGGSSAIYSGSPAIVSVDKISTGVADVTVDRDVALCSVTTTSYYDKYYYVNAKTAGANKIRVYSWYLDATTHAPTYIDNYFYLSVHC